MAGDARAPALSKRLAAESIGTALLLSAVVGSGIMGERLSGGNVAIALLANSIATGAVLIALILTFGPLSGAHFNPAVSLAARMQGGLSTGELAGYGIAQVLGALAGVAAAHAMFALPLIQTSMHSRAGLAQAGSEIVATFGLLAVILSCARRQSASVATAVGAYIAGAYWFTASTSFANPAVTIARAFTDTFAGIQPTDVPAFLAAQVIGTVLAVALFAWLDPPDPPREATPR
jgi:glycerol uptake facilitator-like aquaporin